ncbi:MAG: DUF3098 domain-containing protein [Flavobacteriales bacterium]|jgi:hypothetical protein|nr:DUF3098 domain-containing protein [Flavobacteriaceae bacterium]RZP07418.1 MAG: DUF3098 domain-containing protein [Flavobacteriales bacterium]|tara:strand:+ start:945 stop:1187 length:243 start_codon:yes stop_codon:yes gene_type:complete
MKEKKGSNKKLLFTKKNYLISCIGLIFILIGFIIMSGGESNDPNIFNEEIYSFRRIRVAPLLVLIGLGIQVYAILISDKK